jgi:hypothetical protein
MPEITFGALSHQLESTHSTFRRLQNAKSTLQKVSLALEELTKLGDTVTLDDVVKVTGDLVAHGLDPSSMAGILADAPEKGEALASWVAQQAQQIAGRQAQLEPVLQSHQHRLGVEALQTLVAEMGVGAQPQINALGAQAMAGAGPGLAPLSPEGS